MEINRISTDELADLLRIAKSTARSFVNGNRQITAEKAVEIEKRIGIPRETLRPDIFVRRMSA